MKTFGLQPISEAGLSEAPIETELQLVGGRGGTRGQGYWDCHQTANLLTLGNKPIKLQLQSTGVLWSY